MLRGAGGHPPAHPFEHVLADQVARRQLDGVLPIEARPAEPGLRLLGRRDQAGQRDVAERVGADRTPDALGVQPVGQQLRTGGEVDAVEARPLDRRRGDPYVHLQGARLAQHAHDRPLRVAAHDRVVDHHDPLAPHVLPQRVELEPDAELAQGLRRLDEGAPDVRVLHEALAVGDAGLLGVADRRRGAGLGHRDDQVGLHRVLLGQLAADLHPRGVHVPAGDGGVRAGHVDVLEEAALGLRHGEPGRAQAVLVDRDQLARLDLADHARADDVERRRLAGHHPAALQPAEHQRAYAVRVAGRVEGRLVHEDEAERAAQSRQHLHRGRLDGEVGAAGQQHRHEGRVVGRAVGRQPPVGDLALEIRRVDQVAVVSEGDRRAGAGRPEGRLGVLPGRAAGGGVARVADGHVPAQARQRRLVEDLRDQAEILVDDDTRAVAHRDTGGLLAPVLQRVETEVGQVGDLLPGAHTPKTPHASWGPGRWGSRSWLSRPSPRGTCRSLMHGSVTGLAGSRVSDPLLGRDHWFA